MPVAIIGKLFYIELKLDKSLSKCYNNHKRRDSRNKKQRKEVLSVKAIGNILWFVFTGLVSALAWFFMGLIWCITIIGIPFGRQCFKLARLSLWPFGTTVTSNFGKHPIANIIWFIFGGLSLCLGYFFWGILWCITIIGIPFGKQCFKLGQLAAFPFGTTVSK